MLYVYIIVTGLEDRAAFIGFILLFVALNRVDNLDKLMIFRTTVKCSAHGKCACTPIRKFYPHEKPPPNKLNMSTLFVPLSLLVFGPSQLSTFRFELYKGPSFTLQYSLRQFSATSQYSPYCSSKCQFRPKIVQSRPTRCPFLSDLALLD